MKKSERQLRLKELMGDDGLTEEILAQMVEESGVTEATIKKDLAEINGVVDDGENPNGSNSTDEGEQIITVKFTEKEKNNAELRKGRVESYTVPSNERDTVHVELEKIQYGRGGSFSKVSKPFIQKFDQRAWLKFRLTARQLGYSHVRILYAPETMKAADLKVVELDSNVKKV